MKKLIVLALLVAIAVPSAAFAKGGGGGGRSSGGSRSATSVSKPSTTATAPKPAAAPTTPKPAPAPKPSTSPSKASNVKTSDTAKQVGGKNYGTKGYVVDDKFQPKFRNGYTAPAGSTVYYQDRGSDWMMWIPMWYILASNNDPHREAVVQQPDGKEEIVKEEGLDTMWLVNWIITILIGVGLIAGIVYLVNKFTFNKPAYV